MNTEQQHSINQLTADTKTHNN